MTRNRFSKSAETYTKLFKQLRGEIDGQVRLRHKVGTIDLTLTPKPDQQQVARRLGLARVVEVTEWPWMSIHK